MKRILVANPFGIGDVIFSLASVQKLRQAYPDAFIGFVCNERTEEFLTLCPVVNRLHVFNRDHLRASLKKSPFAFLGEIKKLLSSARTEKYDTLIDFSLGREFAFAGLLLGIRHRVGFDYKGRGVFLTRKRKITAYADIPVAQAQLDFLAETGILPDSGMPASIEIRVPESPFDFQSGEKVLAVAPGGGRSWGNDAIYKQWDAEKFADAALALIAADSRLRLVLIGDEAERPLLEKVRVRTGAALVLAGEPIAKVCGILKKTDLLLCNDGGLLHLANALGVKTVSIFGPVDERVYGPYGGGAAAKVLTEQVPCRPCYQKFHFPGCAYERRCLTGISPDKVVEAAREIL